MGDRGIPYTPRDIRHRIIATAPANANALGESTLSDSDKVKLDIAARRASRASLARLIISSNGGEVTVGDEIITMEDLTASEHGFRLDPPCFGRRGVGIRDAISGVNTGIDGVPDFDAIRPATPLRNRPY
jgi:hypothetical protein